MKFYVYVAVLTARIACLVAALYLTVTSACSLTVLLLWISLLLGLIGDDLFKSISEDYADIAK